MARASHDESGACVGGLTDPPPGEPATLPLNERVMILLRDLETARTCDDLAHLFGCARPAMQAALSALRAQLRVQVSGKDAHGTALWVAVRDGDVIFDDRTQRSEDDAERIERAHACADARFAERIGPHRYSDVPTRPRVVWSSSRARCGEG